MGDIPKSKNFLDSTKKDERKEEISIIAHANRVLNRLV